MNASFGSEGECWGGTDLKKLNFNKDRRDKGKWERPKNDKERERAREKESYRVKKRNVDNEERA